MAYDTYVILPGMLGLGSSPVRIPSAGTTTIPSGWGPMTVLPRKPIFVANGNGVTLVTGDGAAGARPGHGQQWPRGTHVVLSQFATTYAGIGQR